MANPQQDTYQVIVGARGYRSRSDISATPQGYLVSGSQNVLINEATEDGDKVESRRGYSLFGSASSSLDNPKSEFTWKTKAGDTIMLRYNADGVLQFYSETSDAWEDLLSGLNGSYPCRFTTAHNGTELIRVMLFVNHSANLYEWSGAMGTLAAVAAGTVTINETIATQGFFTSGTRSIRIKDSGGTWRETVYTGQSGSVFTVSTDLTAFTFSANALVVQVVRTNASKPAVGFIADTIATLQNHVYIGSHSSSVVYMSQSDDYTDFSFSSPRIPTEGWQFVLDDFNIGFKTNIGGNGLESLVMFAGNDWVYRVEFEQLGDTTIIETLKVKPIIVSSGQGALSQELIAKLGNSIVYVSANKQLLDVGEFERNALTQVPLSDPIRPDFLAADFTGGALRFHKNNLYCTAPNTTRMFILSFRETAQGTRSFWQPPQILAIGQMSEYNNALIGHAISVKESYTMFDGFNDNGAPISCKAHFSYNNSGSRDKQKVFDKYFTEMYISANAEVVHKLIYEYLGARNIKEYTYTGTDSDFLFTPNPSASLGVNALGTSPLGGYINEISNMFKYRRFKKTNLIDHFEFQVRYEMDTIDGSFQLVAHGPNARISTNAKQKIVN